MNPNTIPIKLVHFTNPSRFYFRDLMDEEAEVEQIETIESKLGSYIESLDRNYRKSLKFYQPRVGQLVAFYTEKDKKWIRCEVDESKKFNDVTTVIMWAIDYGVPLYTTHLQNMVPLHQSFRNPKSKIMTGCLGLLPSSSRYDYEAGRLVKDVKETWGNLALKSMVNLVRSYQKVHFVQSHHIPHEDLHIGDLFFGNVSLSFCLLEKEAAVTVPANLFLNYYSKLFTKHIERWNDNERTGGVLKCPDASDCDFESEFILEKPAETDATSGTNSFTEECVRKVRDWQERNDKFFIASEKSESVISSQSGHPRHFNSPAIYEPEVDEFAGVSAKELRRMLEQQMQENEEVKQDFKSRMVLLPAGSSMVAYDNNSSLFDENFLSVSQVNAEEGEELMEDQQYDGDGIQLQQHDSIDSMVVRLQSQKF